MVADLGSYGHAGRLALGDSYQRSVEAILPQGLSGEFHVVLETGGPFEFLNTDNNRAVSDEPLTVSLSPPPDLQVRSVTAPDTITAGSRIDIGWTVENRGSGDAVDLWSDSVSLEAVGDPTAKPILLKSFNYTKGLEAGLSYSRSELLQIPDCLLYTSDAADE